MNCLHCSHCLHCFHCLPSYIAKWLGRLEHLQLLTLLVANMIKYNYLQFTHNISSSLYSITRTQGPISVKPKVQEMKKICTLSTIFKDLFNNTFNHSFVLIMLVTAMLFSHDLAKYLSWQEYVVATNIWSTGAIMNNIKLMKLLACIHKLFSKVLLPWDIAEFYSACLTCGGFWTFPWLHGCCQRFAEHFLHNLIIKHLQMCECNWIHKQNLKALENYFSRTPNLTTIRWKVLISWFYFRKKKLAMMTV